MIPDYVVDARKGFPGKAMRDIFAEQLRDFRRPILCSITSADGSIYQLCKGELEAAFELTPNSKPITSRCFQLPLNIMFVDSDGLELNLHINS